jgi:PAS domain S-box-containing protein
MVIRHTYPTDLPAFGYDLYDPDQAYRNEVQAAVDSGQLVATPPLRLARDRSLPDAPERTSVVVRAALYSGGLVPASQAERRQRLLGVAGVAFRTQPLVESVLRPQLGQDWRLRLQDAALPADSPQALLYDSLPGQALDTAPLWTGQIAVADREWVLSAHARGPWAGGMQGQQGTGILLLFGAGLSLALAGLTRGLAQANLAADARLRAAALELQREGEQLRQSEARFRMLFEKSFDAVLRTEPSGRVLAANAAACKLFGATPAQLQALQREQLVDLSDERLGTLLAERQCHGHAAGLLRMRRLDGSVFEAELSSSLYTDVDGRLNSSMIIRDVTERQRLAQRLQDKQRMEAIGTLAGGVAHDFNNMLAGILANLGLAQAALPAGEPVQERLQLARRAAERARTLVRQILTFSRRGPLSQRVQALQPLVQEAVNLLQVTVPPSVRLEVTLAAPVLHARVDGGQVQQLLLNLCTNAWQALAGQPGVVRVLLQPVQLQAPEARALGLAAGAYACLQVQDDGPGMDAATQARVFEPFFTTKPLGEGTGLGLAVVHGVVTESAGAIHLDSAPGRGACFSIYLPLQPAPAAEATAGGAGAQAAHAATAADPAAAAAPAAGLAGRQVLYVDDDEVVALTATALLERAGLQVRCCSRGDEALAALRSAGACFDVLVTDFNMPGMTGLELVAAARTVAPGLGVVLVSGLIDDDLQARTHSLGLRQVLPKEEILEKLVEAVRQALPPA